MTVRGVICADGSWLATDTEEHVGAFGTTQEEAVDAVERMIMRKRQLVAQAGGVVSSDAGVSS